MKLNSSATRSRDILPMEVADMTFLVNRLGEDCAPLQYVRELTQNAIEAPPHEKSGNCEYESPRSLR